jgi:hypothetical protein
LESPQKLWSQLPGVSLAPRAGTPVRGDGHRWEENMYHLHYRDGFCASYVLLFQYI